MTVLAALHTRNSHPRLTQPGPNQDALESILHAGLRAPDHARLRPWQFVVIQDNARERLGRVFERSLLLKKPDAADAEREKARCAPLRAPLIVAGLLKPVEHPKVPRVEQVAAVACALHGMSLASEALGFGTMWRTGDYARDPVVIESLGGTAGDEIIGFLYIGTREGAVKPLPNGNLSAYVSHL